MSFIHDIILNEEDNKNVRTKILPLQILEKVIFALLCNNNLFKLINCLNESLICLLRAICSLLGPVNASHVIKMAAIKPKPISDFLSMMGINFRVQI
jgi:hypothetical protein